jgi:acetoin utilization deacetylase AcuC-like enzyme
MRFIYSPRYVVDLGGHVFPTKKFALVAESLRGTLPFVEPLLPSRDEILLVHTPEWTDKVIESRMSLEDETQMELPFSKELSVAHRLAVSGTILACHDALNCGVGLHIGGGSHHAFSGHGEGFCVLNDIACGIMKMIQEKKIARAAVIDLDVHQGNGSAEIFSNNENVFTFSIHQEGIYPEKKNSSSLDVVVKAGTSDHEYLRLLESNLLTVFAHKPELIVYQAGVDCFEKDLLGGLKLTQGGLLRRDRMVLEFCQRFKVPVAVTLGGGYGANLQETVDLHAQTLSCFVESL